MAYVAQYFGLAGVPKLHDIALCPYDICVVEIKRMADHLVTCRQRHMAQLHDYTTCPFNAEHEMPRMELPYHYANCPDCPSVILGLAEGPEQDQQGAVVDCPYRCRSTVTIKGMPDHLVECRQRHMERIQENATCPFNAEHEMPRVELRFHVDHCPDKNNVEADQS